MDGETQLLLSSSFIKFAENLNKISDYKHQFIHWSGSSNNIISLKPSKMPFKSLICLRQVLTYEWIWERRKWCFAEECVNHFFFNLVRIKIPVSCVNHTATVRSICLYIHMCVKVGASDKMPLFIGHRNHYGSSIIMPFIVFPPYLCKKPNYLKWHMRYFTV